MAQLLIKVLIGIKERKLDWTLVVLLVANAAIDLVDIYNKLNP